MNILLRTVPISAESRAALDAELEHHDDAEIHRRALRSERAVGLEAYAALFGRMPWLRGRFRDDAGQYLDVIEHQLALADEPYAAMLAADPPHAASELAPLAGLAEPAITRSRAAFDRTRALIRCLRVLNALQAHDERTGVAEPRLEELDLPEHATTDPFNGEPLHVVKTPDGWLVYSVGENLTDDGGALDDNLDVGVGPLPRP